MEGFLELYSCRGGQPSLPHPLPDHGGVAVPLLGEVLRADQSHHALVNDLLNLRRGHIVGDETI